MFWMRNQQLLNLDMIKLIIRLILVESNLDKVKSQIYPLQFK